MDIASGISLCVSLVFLMLQPLSYDFAVAQTNNKIEFVYYVEQLKGHLEQAIANKENGNNSLSRAHILHSMAEIYDFIEVPLVTSDVNLNALLFHSLDGLSNNVEGTSVGQFKRDIEQVNRLLDKANDIVIRERNSTLNLIAAAWLLDVATEKYESGVKNGNVTHLIDYQDTIGFISRSESLVNNSLPTLNQSMTIPAERAMSIFPSLNLKIQHKAVIDDIQTSTAEIKKEISNITRLYLP